MRDEQLTKIFIMLGWAFLLLFPMVSWQVRAEGTQYSIELYLKPLLILMGLLTGMLTLRLLLQILKHTPVGQKTATALTACQTWFTVTGAFLQHRVFQITLLVALLLFPLGANPYTLDTAINVFLYITLALGLNVVVGMAGLLDLGYVAFYAVGAYTYALLNVHFAFPFWAVLPIGAVLGAICGIIIGYPTLRMRGDYLAIVTLGFGEIIRIVLNNWNSLTGGPNGIMGIRDPSTLFYRWLGGFSFQHTLVVKYMYQYYLILGIALLTLIFVRRIRDSRIGWAWTAIREDEMAAAAMGVNTAWMKLLAYIVGAVIASVAGAFFAGKLRFIDPTSFTFIESILILCMVVLGGMGSIPGVILGAAVLVILPEAFREFQNYRMLAFGGALTLMMIFRPEGFIPEARHKLELHATEPVDPHVSARNS